MSGLPALAKPRRIKASHRRRWRIASGQSVQRYYDPQIGRFLSVDPVTAYSNPVGAFNRYWYASNNPYKFVDPDGRTDVNNFLQNDHGGLFYNAAAAFDLPGTFTVGSHGNESIIQDQTRAPYENWDAYQTYSNAVSMGLKPGEPVFSLSCRFGMTNSLGVNQAQVMADKNGSKVTGADGWINYKKQGDTTTMTVWSGRNGTGKQGAFQQFAPGGKGNPVAGSAIKSISVNTKTGTVTLRYGQAETGSRIPRTETFKLKDDKLK